MAKLGCGVFVESAQGNITNFVGLHLIFDYWNGNFGAHDIKLKDVFTTFDGQFDRFTSWAENILEDDIAGNSGYVFVIYCDDDIFGA